MPSNTPKYEDPSSPRETDIPKIVDVQQAAKVQGVGKSRFDLFYKVDDQLVPVAEIPVLPIDDVKVSGINHGIQYTKPITPNKVYMVPINPGVQANVFLGPNWQDGNILHLRNDGGIVKVSGQNIDDGGVGIDLEQGKDMLVGRPRREHKDQDIKVADSTATVSAYQCTMKVITVETVDGASKIVQEEPGGTFRMPRRTDQTYLLLMDNGSANGTMVNAKTFESTTLIPEKELEQGVTKPTDIPEVDHITLTTESAPHQSPFNIFLANGMNAAEIPYGSVTEAHPEIMAPNYTYAMELSGETEVDIAIGGIDNLDYRVMVYLDQDSGNFVVSPAATNETLALVLNQDISIGGDLNQVDVFVPENDKERNQPRVDPTHATVKLIACDPQGNLILDPEDLDRNGRSHRFLLLKDNGSKRGSVVWSTDGNQTQLARK